MDGEGDGSADSATSPLAAASFAAFSRLARVRVRVRARARVRLRLRVRVRFAAFSRRSRSLTKAVEAAFGGWRRYRQSS